MPKTTWYLCLSKKQGSRKIEVKVVRATTIPETGEKIQIVARFPRKKWADEIRDLYTDKYLISQWGTMFFIEGRDTIPEHVQKEWR